MHPRPRSGSTRASSHAQDIFVPEIIIQRGDDGQIVKRFQKLNTLGRGGFASVYRVQDMKTHEFFALKTITHRAVEKARDKLHQEIRIQSSLSHPNILRFISAFEDSYNFYILLELCEKNCLMDLHKRKGRMNDDEARWVVWGLLTGMKHMHYNCVIHRDLKLGNIMMDAGIGIKIGDFGLAAQLSHAGERKTTMCGTPNYIAPEVISKNKGGHSFEVDTWSLGVILYTLLVGHPPFETAEISLTYDRIKSLNYHFPSAVRVSSEAKDLVKRILQSDPKKRPTLEEIERHPFLHDHPIPTGPPKGFWVDPKPSTGPRRAQTPNAPSPAERDRFREPAGTNVFSAKRYGTPEPRRDVRASSPGAARHKDPLPATHAPHGANTPTAPTTGYSPYPYSSPATRRGSASERPSGAVGSSPRNSANTYRPSSQSHHHHTPHSQTPSPSALPSSASHHGPPSASRVSGGYTSSPRSSLHTPTPQDRYDSRGYGAHQPSPGLGSSPAYSHRTGSPQSNHRASGGSSDAGTGYGRPSTPTTLSPMAGGHLPQQPYSNTWGSGRKPPSTISPSGSTHSWGASTPAPPSPGRATSSPTRQSSPSRPSSPHSSPWAQPPPHLQTNTQQQQQQLNPAHSPSPGPRSPRAASPGYHQAHHTHTHSNTHGSSTPTSSAPMPTGSGSGGWHPPQPHSPPRPGSPYAAQPDIYGRKNPALGAATLRNPPQVQSPRGSRQPASAYGLGRSGSTKDETRVLGGEPGPVWVQMYADFPKYGLAYRLSNGHVGAIFNDGTRIVWDPLPHGRVEYTERSKERASDGTVLGRRTVVTVCTMENYEPKGDLKKKLDLTSFFNNYFKRNGVKEAPPPELCILEQRESPQTSQQRRYGADEYPDTAKLAGVQSVDNSDDTVVIRFTQELFQVTCVKQSHTIMISVRQGVGNNMDLKYFTPQGVRLVPVEEFKEDRANPYFQRFQSALSGWVGSRGAGGPGQMA